MSRQQEIQKWWDHKKTIYPFHAFTSSTLLKEKKLTPASLFAEHKLDFVSVELVFDCRTWGFKTEADRDLFINLYGATKL